MIAFVNDKQSIGNKETSKWEREIYETLGNIKSNFHSEVNAFTALEKKCDENVDIIKQGKVQTNLYDHIMRIIGFLMRWLLQIEKGYCLGKWQKHHGIKKKQSNSSFLIYGELSWQSTALWQKL